MYPTINWFIQPQLKYMDGWMYDLSFKVRYRRELLLLIAAISATFFIADYNFFFASSAEAQGQSQSTTSVCNGNGGSCFTTFCSNDQPCQTFSSNQPSFVQPAQEGTTVMQPDDEVTEQPIEVPVEICDDGIDNDDDSEVDEECRAATFSSASPIQGQPNDVLEQPSEEDDESNEVSEGKKD